MATTNEKLLTTAYAATHHAADQVTELTNATAGDRPVLAKEAAPQLTALKQNLQSALCAVTELERRARGGEPVFEG